MQVQIKELSALRSQAPLFKHGYESHAFPKLVPQFGPVKLGKQMHFDLIGLWMEQTPPFRQGLSRHVVVVIATWHRVPEKPA